MDKSYYICSYRELGIRPIAVLSNCKSFNCNGNLQLHIPYVSDFHPIRQSSAITIKHICCEIYYDNGIHICYDEHYRLIAIVSPTYDSARCSLNA